MSKKVHLAVLDANNNPSSIRIPAKVNKKGIIDLDSNKEFQSLLASLGHSKSKKTNTNINNKTPKTASKCEKKAPPPVKKQKRIKANLKINKYKKQPIPESTKALAWDRWIGNEIGKCKCLCCKSLEITQRNCHFGHIVAEANGGNITINNLRPICQKCNNSMNITNMKQFIKKYEYHQTNCKCSICSSR